MGMIDRFLGVGAAAQTLSTAATNVTEVFRENATRRMELDEEAYARALAQYGLEFTAAPRGRFDDLVNGLNRLPRPMLTLGTISLFVYAMVEPIGFGQRMLGLQAVPEPLWWLLGGIVSFYFGAREAHYFRNRTWPPAIARQIEVTGAIQSAAAPDPGFGGVPAPAAATSDNPALRDWVAERQGAAG
ncbi:holin family protein [Paracoccus jeotgali]|uniref:holin family protein n=1 Tax=Paracoccus jeotgali TaxID=2065379 RepID=UPI0028A6412C|nr:holin family protein [Paracoccus jeotgali]